MPNIVESIGAWGVKTTPDSVSYVRMERPRSGDIVLFMDKEYPHNNSQYGRIEHVSGSGDVDICCNLGSAYLYQDGSVEISGGPFETVALDELHPTHSLYEAEYWNWGDRGGGAGHGVYYKINRPVFKLTKKVAEKKIRQ